MKDIGAHYNKLVGGGWKIVAMLAVMVPVL